MTCPVLFISDSPKAIWRGDFKGGQTFGKSGAEANIQMKEGSVLGRCIEYSLKSGQQMGWVSILYSSRPTVKEASYENKLGHTSAQLVHRL